MKHEITDQGDPRIYWTQIPNAICKIGLDPYELALYVHLKQTAGADGKCWKSTATLARETGMSSGKVSSVKLSLAQKNKTIGKALITIQEIPNKDGGKPKHSITLTDVWRENLSLCKTSSPDEVEASSPDEQQVHVTGNQVHGVNVTSSPREIKKNALEEEPKKKNPEEEVFEFWKTHLSHPRAFFDDKRRKAVNARLRDGYSSADLILAVRGCKLSPHNMGENDRQEIYDDLELICRDTPHVERFIARAELESNGNGNGKPRTQSERNIANLKGSLALFQGRSREDNSQEPIDIITSDARTIGEPITR